jgi:hypothetical protein
MKKYQLDLNKIASYRKKAIIPKEEKKEEDESFYLEEWF